MLKSVLKEKGLTVYSCSKLSGIPYTTLLDIINDKCSLANCSGIVLYKLSKTLGLSMETLVDLSNSSLDDFELFKSEIKHRIKNESMIVFMINVLMNEEVERYWDNFQKAKALYLVACLDYISRINEVPLVTRYNEMRSYAMDNMIWPKDYLLLKDYMPESYGEDLIKNAIPEFLAFNIVEGNINDVC